jgi:hypothetical protein
MNRPGSGPRPRPGTCNKWLNHLLVESAGSVGRMHGKNYRDLGPDWHLRRDAEAHIRRPVTQLERLGHTVARDTPAAQLEPSNNTGLRPCADARARITHSRGCDDLAVTCLSVSGFRFVIGSRPGWPGLVRGGQVSLNLASVAAVDLASPVVNRWDQCRSPPPSSSCPVRLTLRRLHGPLHHGPRRTRRPAVCQPARMLAGGPCARSAS